ncbi:hypothetical protein [Coxiella-like endosymbiont]|nr:hypothetical protein [Coxiella-like endosymbiont]
MRQVISTIVDGHGLKPIEELIAHYDEQDVISYLDQFTFSQEDRDEGE